MKLLLFLSLTSIIGIVILFQFLCYLEESYPIKDNKFKSYLFTTITLIIFLILLNQSILLINGTTK